MTFKERFQNRKFRIAFLAAVVLVGVLIAILLYVLLSRTSSSNVITNNPQSFAVSYVIDDKTGSIVSFTVPVTVQPTTNNPVVNQPTQNTPQQTPESYAYVDPVVKAEDDDKLALSNAGGVAYSCDQITSGAAEADLKQRLVGNWEGNVFIRNWNVMMKVKFSFKADNFATATNENTYSNSPFYFSENNANLERAYEVVSDSANCEIKFKVNGWQNSDETRYATFDTVIVSPDGIQLNFIMNDFFGYESHYSGTGSKADEIRYYLHKVN